MACVKTIIVTFITGIAFADIVIQPDECPGMYCGRMNIGPARYSDCGACPRGYQAENSVCGECTSSPDLYDWLYLGFMAITSILLHCFFIDYTNVKKESLVVLHLSAVVESVMAAILTLLLADPLGSLSLRSCPVARLQDWYSMLYNPSPNYTTTLHCTQEIVYPLYTIVMIYYAFSLVFMMCLRPFISYQFVDCLGTKSIYAALYFLPILIVVQALLAGLLYYSFPYILIIVTLITSAVHLFRTVHSSVKDLIKENLTDARRLIILICHWVLHGYGIISLTELKNPELHGPVLLLVFCPTVFYVTTTKFTNPSNLQTAE
ncbi:JNK1/MAPK8-associated membrane protein-like [Dreissena polymorpha]|uniref:JNK1/MAPK8-associated membrane protein-like n=1 Tax=Dreissena polymorpha TaxID=45954 RepID=UPI002263F8A3|nr:JNK1/MAPK8-associated membrane protein-like [Dreissena polymorpha]